MKLRIPVLCSLFLIICVVTASADRPLIVNSRTFQDILRINEDGTDSVLLTHSPTVYEYYCALSPNGRYLATVSYSPPEVRLYDNLLGTDTLLTTEAWGAPVWAHGNTWVAWAGYGAGRVSINLYYPEFDIGLNILRDSTIALDSCLAVSPSDDEITFMDIGGGLGVGMITVPTGEIRIVYRGSWFYYNSPAWSPDGRWIAFGPRLLHTDGSGLVVLDSIDGWSACWSPDSRYLYYQTTHVGNPYRVPADGSAPSEMLGITNAWFDLSPDGTRILFSTAHGIYSCALDRSDLIHILGSPWSDGIGRWTRTWDPATTSVRYAIHSGWNLLSMPLEPDYPAMDSLFPFRAGGAWAWRPDSGYLTLTELHPGLGFWLLCDRDTLVQIHGRIVDSLVLDLARGWNLFGGIMSPTRWENTLWLPAEGITTYPHRYNAGTGAYLTADSLNTGEGYWIMATESTRLWIPAMP